MSFRPPNLDMKSGVETSAEKIRQLQDAQRQEETLQISKQRMFLNMQKAQEMQRASMLHYQTQSKPANHSSGISIDYGSTNNLGNNP